MKRKVLMAIGLVFLALIVLFLSGPRVEIDTTLQPVQLPEDLDGYLAKQEAVFTDLVPETEKTIVWAESAGQKTPLSIIYLHGFSATRQETAPLADLLAAELGANLYYARLTGHGRSGEALADATVNDWLNDTHEALEIGKRLGDDVIVMGVSTGATAATWLAAQPVSESVRAFILISPNYAPGDSTAEILTLPWAESMAKMLIGPERQWEPDNEEHGRFWTNRYPTEALLPMMGLVKIAREGNHATITQPVLVIYSPNDQVINPQRVEDVFDEIGSGKKQIVAIENSQDSSNHVLAGNILAPNDTENILNIILDFLAGGSLN